MLILSGIFLFNKPWSIRVKLKTFLHILDHLQQGHQRGARGHHVARKDHVPRPRACYEMINVFTLTNINDKVTEGKLSKIFIS